MFNKISLKTASLLKIAVNLDDLKNIQEIIKPRILPAKKIKSIFNVFGPVTTPFGLNIKTQKDYGISFKKPIINKSHGGLMKVFPKLIDNENKGLLELTKNNVKDFFSQAREQEFELLSNLTNIPQNLINQRFSRHAIKHITNNYIDKVKKMQQGGF